MELNELKKIDIVLSIGIIRCSRFFPTIRLSRREIVLGQHEEKDEHVLEL